MRVFKSEEKCWLLAFGMVVTDACHVSLWLAYWHVGSDLPVPLSDLARGLC